MSELSENFNTMMKPKNCEAYPSFSWREKETNYQKSSIEMKKDVNKTIKEKRHNKTDVYDAKF